LNRDVDGRDKPGHDEEEAFISGRRLKRVFGQRQNNTVRENARQC